MSSVIFRVVVGCSLLALLPACFEAKKYDTKIRSITFPPLESPVQYSDTPQGKFEEGGPTVSDEFHGCRKEDVFDTRLKVGQKFIEHMVYIDKDLKLGSTVTRVIKSVSHNVIEVHVSRNYGIGAAVETTEICELKPVIEGLSNLYTQCRVLNAKETTAPSSPGNASREICDYQNAKEVSKVVAHGKYTFQNGTKVPAAKVTLVETVDYMCGKADGGKVSKGTGTRTRTRTRTSIIILAKNILKIDRISCRLTTIFNYSSTKGPDGASSGSLSEIVEAPVAQ